MITLQSTGLFLDLVGVSLLGFDLIRIQSNLKKQAKLRTEKLEEITEEYGGVEIWANDLGADWSVYHDAGEGLYEAGFGEFNAEAAQKSFSEATNAITLVAKRTEAISQLVNASYDEDQKSSNASLVFSYIGLVLIVTGFALQIIGTLLN